MHGQILWEQYQESKMKLLISNPELVGAEPELLGKDIVREQELI
jgi:hypothetical protein